MAAAIEQSFEDRDYMRPEAGSVVGRLGMKVEILRYDREADQFELAGPFEADGSAAVWVLGNDGTGLDELQGDVKGAGRFSTGFLVDGSNSDVDVVWGTLVVY